MKRRSALVTLALAVSACGGKYVRPVGDEKVEATPERVIRGGYLVNQVCACGACHTTREHGNIGTEPERTDAFLGGGNVVVAKGMADAVWVPNITPDAETGVGAWSDDQLMRAIRDGVARDGRFMLPVMPFGSYQHMSDEDVRAIVAYLRSVPPYKQPKPRTPAALGTLARVLFTKVGVQMHAPARDVPPPPPMPIPTGKPDEDERNLKQHAIEQGRYVAAIAACAECHSLTKKGPRKPGDPQYLAGSEAPFEDPGIGRVWAPNLTPDKETGLGRFFPDQIKAAIRTGTRLDGKRMAPPMSVLVPHYSGMAEEDLDAVVAYLRSLPPARHGVPQRELAPAGKALYGE